MTELRLRQDVHLAVVGDDVAVLSVADDAYACWVGVAAEIHVIAPGLLRIGDPGLAAELEPFAAGARQGDRARVAKTLIVPTRDDRDHATPGADGTDRRHFAGAWGQLLLHYHGRSLKHLIDRSASRSSGGDIVPERAAARSRLFARWLPWAPFQGFCLYRAAFLLDFLHRSGLTADWIFGARTWPFAAHCWLQAGDLVLDDDIDRVRAYTPILVV